MDSACSNVENQTKLTKKQKRQARQLVKTLRTKMFLPEVGTYGFMFETLTNNTTYLCKICKCILSRPEMASHTQDAKHKFLEEQHKVIFKDFYVPHMMDEADPNTNFKLLNALYNVKDKPLLGVEYILEVVFSKNNTRVHLCSLCGFKRVNPVEHLSGTFHTMHYVKTHFKTAHKHFGTMKVRKIKKEHKPILNKLAAAIEGTYGRLKPYQIIAQDNYPRKMILRSVRAGQHFSELDGKTFEDLVVKELAEVSSGQDEPPTTVVKMGQPSNKNKVDNKPQLSTCGEAFNGDEENDYEEKMEVYHKLAKGIEEDMNEVLLKHRQNPEDHPQYNEEWKKFWTRRHMELLAEGRDPSKYDYKPEWKQIWDEIMLKLHNEEIESKKIEAKEMLGLLDEPLSVASSQIKNSNREVVLDGYNEHSQDHENVSCRETQSSTYSMSRNDISSLSSKISPRARNSFPHQRDFSSRLRDPPIRGRDSPHRRDSPSRRRGSPFRRRDSPYRRRDSPSGRRDSPSRRRDSPLRRRYSRSRSRDSPLRRRYSRSRSRDSPLRRRDSPGRSHSPSRPQNDRRRHSPLRLQDRRPRTIAESSGVSLKRKRDPYDNYGDSSRDVDINLVAILGKLAALEDELGSLGPKVIGLLSNALAMENKKLNSSEDLLNSEDNFVLFESAIMRLKDLLRSGLVDVAQKKVFENVTYNAESVINRAKRRKLRDVQESDKVLVVPGVGVVDKEKISQQIVSTLLAQGKRDITQEELDKLIREFASRDRQHLSTGCSTYRDINEENRYNPFSIPQSSRTNNEESYYPSRLEEKRMLELKKLENTRSLVNSLMNNQQNSSSAFSKTGNEGFPNPPSNVGGAYFQGHTNQPLVTYEHLRRGGPSSYQSMSGKNNFEWTGAQKKIIPERHLSREMTGSRGGIVDLRDGLSSHRVKQHGSIYKSIIEEYQQIFTEN